MEHTLIKDNLAREAGNRLKGGPCQVVTSHLRVKVNATGLYTYPDLVIVCDKPQFEDQVQDTLLNPRVVVEVLSDSPEKYDRGTKFAHYRQLPSVQEYVLIAQDRPLVERYVRQADDTWVLTTFSGLTATFDFGFLAAPIPLAEIYRGVQFPETPNRYLLKPVGKPPSRLTRPSPSDLWHSLNCGRRAPAASTRTTAGARRATIWPRVTAGSTARGTAAAASGWLRRPRRISRFPDSTALRRFSRMAMLPQWQMLAVR